MKLDMFNVPRIVFGRGESARLGELLRPMGTKALLIDGAGGAGVVEKLVKSIESAGLKAVTYRHRGEPKIDDVNQALSACRAAGCNCIVSVGGGSAIDLAKAVAGILSNEGEALDYMEVVGKGQRITRPAAPWIALPTTAGTGAEATRNAVIGSPDHRFKASIRSELLLPRVALIDAELGISTPPEVTARSGMDALCQCIESYTSTGATPITDPLALQGVHLAAASLARAFQHGDDLAARERMALAALLSGITLTNAGLGAVHGFAAPLGANFPAPHGTICAVLLPHVMRANITALRRENPSHPSLAKYAQLGQTIAPLPAATPEDAQHAAVRCVEDLVTSLRIPPLSQFGLRDEHIAEMVTLARKSSSMRFNPIVLSDAELTDILHRAIHP